jgi:hypothetical protein
MKRPAVAEIEIGEAVIAHLQMLGADVYQEVDVPGGVADIVARLGAELWIIELKTSLSLALVCQAMERRRHAHRVLIAAPGSKNMRDVARLCDEVGVGLWRVHLGFDYGSPSASVHEEAPARRWNRRPVALAASLREEHKTSAKAGSACAGGRWTPFRETCGHLARVVAGSPGIALKAAITQTRHHYRTMASARSSLATWIAKGKVPGVEMRDGALFPVAIKREVSP